MVCDFGSWYILVAAGLGLLATAGAVYVVFIWYVWVELGVVSFWVVFGCGFLSVVMFAVVSEPPMLGALVKLLLF